ncbi:MAG: outer membrane protein assembly factor BamA [Hyphomonadaceae bacterium]|nr:outer membrane protein assembly factor BamA [Hyphomonadaceae bacterium]
MKRGFRDVVAGVLTSAAAVGVGAGPALAQETPAPPTQDTTRTSTVQPGTAPVGTPAPAAPAARAATPAQPARAQAPAAARRAPAQAQAPAAAVIGRIQVEGIQRIEASTVTSYMSLRPGEPFDPERIDLSIKTLFATGLFADVQIQQRGSDLVVRVVENPIINRVLFEGVRSMKEDTLTDEVQARPRSVFTPARAQADVQRILEVYRRSGRFAATVTPQVRELEQNRVDLIFEIDEGPVTGVRDINFIGNEAFGDRKLQDQIVTTRSHWWNFFSKNDNYDPDRIEYDREQLRQFYTNHGYADFRVVSAVAELTPDQKDFFITFTVDEGEKYDFGAIRVETALDRVPPELLEAAIPIRTGELFEGSMIEDSIDAMSYVAGTVGYANVDIRPRVERDPVNKVVNITFEVNEGPRVFVERIDIVGNTRTVDRVIRREMRVSEGDSFNRILLDRSRSRIRALGFFKSVEVEEQPGTQPDRSVVQVKVEEESTGELAFAAGYSSQESFLFDLSVSERNLRGRGQFLRLRASTSSLRQQFDVRFTEPRFLGRDLAAGFDLFSLRTDFSDQSSFTNQSTGLGLRTSFPLTERTGMGITYSLLHDDTNIANLLVDADGDGATTTDLVDQCDIRYIGRPLLCDQEGTFLTSVFGYSFNWDARNDRIDPTNGFDLSLSQDFAGAGGDVHYLRTELSTGVYRGIVQDVTASFRLNSGYIFGWSGDDVRINDRFFKGGSSFRGFDVAGIGPRQITVVSDASGGVVNTIYGDALGGNLYYIGTLQLSFPLGLPEQFGVSGALFAEAGSLGILDAASSRTTSFTSGGQTYTTFVDDAASFRASAGVSIFWDSPFGPVQFDFAEPFAKSYFDRTETFRFSTRTRF